MALSGAEKTRIGGYISGVGKRQSFLAKAASIIASVTVTDGTFFQGVLDSDIYLQDILTSDMYFQGDLE